VVAAAALVVALVAVGRSLDGRGARPSAHLLPTSDGLRGRYPGGRRARGAGGAFPTVLPAFSPGAPPPAVCERQRGCEQPASGFLLEATGFLVPSGYIGAYRETGARLAVAASRWPGTDLVACAGERPLATTGVRGTRGRLFECPPGAGPHGGDGLLLRWRERGVVIALSVSGRTASYRRLLVRRLAAHLELVPPRG
jgi:hypothetical protein